jgi:hypothetical protein
MSANNNRRYYRARAREWTLGESSKGTPQVVVAFNILDEGAAEKALTWYGYFTDATADRTLESLKHMGFEGDDITILDGLGRNEVSLVVEDEEYEGQTHARVRWVNKAGGLAVKQPLQADKLRAFAAEMKAKLRAGGVKPAPKPASDKRPEPPPLTDADIPF